MYAQCPECLAVYRVRAETLATGRGHARCGSCGADFELLASLVDELPQGAFTTLKRRQAGAPPLLEVPALRPQVERAAAPQRELFMDFDRQARAKHDAAAAPPAFARTRRAPVESRRQGLGWMAGTLALLLALGAQLAWAWREPLLRDARVRGWVESACARLDCRIPDVADPAAIALLARDVRPHPTVPGALVITATMSNRAAFAQRFPVLELTLSDVDDRRVAMRRFRPEEYVATPSVRAAGLAPGATASVALEVADPGKSAIAFEFRFL